MSSSTLVFLIIKVILFFIALCVAPFYEFFCFVFSPFLFFCLPFFSTQLFHFWGSILCSTLVILLSFFPVFLFGLYFLIFFNQCLQVTPCGWWCLKIQELSLDQSTHLFLVMFFLAHHRALFCSEYFPLFFYPHSVRGSVLFSCTSFLHRIIYLC